MGGPGKKQICIEEVGEAGKLRDNKNTELKLRLQAMEQQLREGSLDKKKRGRTRNLALSRKRNAKEKLEIEIPHEFNRIVGQNSQYAITEAGCLTRRFTPLQAAKWAEIDEHKRLGLLRDFKGSFNYGENEHCDNIILAQMNTQYRNYRHKLYKNYFLKGIVPPHVNSQDWKYLTNYFGSKEYKENEKGDMVGQIELYKLTRCRSEDEFDEGCWVNERAKEKYYKMLELQNKKLEEGELIVDEENICGEVLGFKSGYIRGRGAGPKPKRSLPNQNYGKELEEAKRNAKLAHVRAEEAEHQVMVLFDKLDKQQSVIQELKEGLIATQKTMVEGQRSTTEMMSFFDQFRLCLHGFLHLQTKINITCKVLCMELAHRKFKILVKTLMLFRTNLSYEIYFEK